MLSQPNQPAQLWQEPQLLRANAFKKYHQLINKLSSDLSYEERCFIANFNYYLTFFTEDVADSNH